MVVVDETPVDDMDTIKWKEIPTDSIPPYRVGQSNGARRTDERQCL